MIQKKTAFVCVQVCLLWGKQVCEMKLAWAAAFYVWIGCSRIVGQRYCNDQPCFGSVAPCTTFAYVVGSARSHTSKAGPIVAISLVNNSWTANSNIKRSSSSKLHFANMFASKKADLHTYSIVTKYRKGAASNTDRVVIARQKFQCQQPACPFQQCVAHTVTDTPAKEQRESTTMPGTLVTKPLDSTPAEVNGAGQSKGTTVKKRAKTALDQSPPQIITSSPTINITWTHPEMDVDAQLKRIFAAVTNGGPFTTAQARVEKREVTRLHQLKR